MERLTQTSGKGGVAFTFDLDITCQPSEAKKILKLAEKLKSYEDAEEQGLPLRWIPCSEQIPEEPEENPLFDGKCLEVYLVTTKYGSSEQDKVYPFRAFWNGINFTDGMNILDVIAWMPLPKPYREREE